MSMLHRLAACCTLVASVWAVDANALPKPLPIAGADSIRNLRYLPEWRYGGDPGPRRDYELLLDLHLPAGPRQRRPLVMFVHGGAYSAGNKDDGYPAGLIKVLVDGGFAVGVLNYILTPKGIFPQVWWDFEESARYLRSHADTYGLDPNAFGAVGISAGGWLIATAGHADGRTYTRGINSYAALEGLDARTLAENNPKETGERSFLRPTLAPATAYPGISGRWQALAYDFDQCRDRANGFTPSLLGFVGTGNATMPKELAAAGVEWTPAILTDPYFATRGVHAPKLVNEGHERERSITRTLDGSGQVQLADVIRDWFRRELTGATARAPVPEIWPTDRLVQGPVEVTLVVPDPASVVRYTTDGSDPGPASPRYVKPFTVAPGTRVRAMAELAGRRPSRVAEARFIATEPLVRITAPDGRDLPPARTGQPYSVRFTASVDQARWSLQGDLAPYVPDKSKTMLYPNNLMLDGNGTLSGTPTTPGTYWLQVWVNGRPGQIATHRDYRLVVTGQPVGPQQAGGTATADDNREIATLGPWREEDLAALRERLQAAGVRAVLQDLPDRRIMLLAPATQAAAARAALAALMRERPKSTPAELAP
ncbi:MAG: hypothetical protein RLZZ127_741 [Planctomycetota bacterium]|jgi:hypothetical protein